MSEQLREFLSDWIKWVDAGGDDGKPFWYRHGLCASFDYWLSNKGAAWYDIESERFQLVEVFKNDGLSAIYPFSSVEQFYEESDKDAMHLNKSRLAWVRSKVAQYEVV